jgi:hypothetical protein
MSRTDELQRTEPLTRERFERLPFLIPLAVAIEWTGLNKHDISLLVARGLLTRRGSPKGKYFRDEIARILWPMDEARSGRIGPDRGESGATSLPTD